MPYFWLAMGHLWEASREMESYPELAQEVANIRMSLIGNENNPYNSCRLNIAAAIILVGEFADDSTKYDVHFWYAMGHLEKACRDIWAKQPKFAEMIRDLRLKMMEDDNFWPDLMTVIELATQYALIDPDNVDIEAAHRTVELPDFSAVIRKATEYAIIENEKRMKETSDDGQPSVGNIHGDSKKLSTESNKRKKQKV